MMFAYGEDIQTNLIRQLDRFHEIAQANDGVDERAGRGVGMPFDKGV
jgi:hypothetical protein